MKMPAQPDPPELKGRSQAELGTQPGEASVWKLTWQCSNALVLALLIGTMIAVPAVRYSLLVRFKSYAEVVYLVGNSPPEESRVIQWARTSPGVEGFRCDRHGGELWARWEYRGREEPEALRNAPQHLRALGYSYSGLHEISEGAVPRNTSGRVADVLSDPFALTAVLLGTQLGFCFVAFWRIRATAREGRALPALFARNYCRAVLTGLAAGLALFGVGWLYTTVLKLYLGASPPSPWDAVEAMPTSTRLAVLLFGVLGAPVAEEIFFRGYVFGLFKGSNQVGYGISISAGLFALAHFADLYNLPVVFLFGVVLAWAFHRTGSLFTSVLAHALNNGLAIGATLLR